MQPQTSSNGGLGALPNDAPDWRWRRAQLASPPPLPGVLPRDAVLEQAVDFARRCRDQSREQARAQYPAIATAEELNSQPSLRDQLKLLVLADCSPAEIAERLKLDEPTIQVWEKLYFDVRELLKATDWIRIHVIDPVRETDPALAVKLRCAYVGGPSAARTLLDADSRMPRHAGERLYQMRLKWLVLARQAAEMIHRSEKDPFRILKLNAELMKFESRLRLQRKRFVQKCREARRKHQIAKYREERLAAQAAAKAERRAAMQRNRELAHQLQLRELELRHAAEQELAHARLNSSPLAQLRWDSAPAEEPTVDQQDPVHPDSVVPAPAVSYVQAQIAPDELDRQTAVRELETHEPVEESTPELEWLQDVTVVTTL